MKVYIATRFTNKDAFRVMKECLERRGHTITHDWSDDNVENVPEEDRPEHLSTCAAECVMGVLNAEVVVLLAVPDMAGAFVELGIAIGAGIPVVMLDAFKPGNRSCIFYSIPQTVIFRHVHSSEELFTALNEINGVNRFIREGQQLKQAASALLSLEGKSSSAGPFVSGDN